MPSSDFQSPEARRQESGILCLPTIMASLGIAILLAPSASAQNYAAGSSVQASPMQMDSSWQSCTVVSGPGANDYYQLNCSGTVMSVPSRWMRAGGGAAAPAAMPQAAAPAAGGQGGTFAAGATVEASPIQLDSSWQPCTVMSGPGANDYYQLNCSGTVMSVPSRWMRAGGGAPAAAPAAPAAAAPAAEPAAAAAPAPAAPPAAAAPAPVDANQPANAGGDVVPGRYECTAWNRANASLNFTITGPGQYQAADGSMGTYQFDAASKQINFSGALSGLPPGTTAIYYTPKGRPTVSFRRQGEIAFCEKTG